MFVTTSLPIFHHAACECYFIVESWGSPLVSEQGKHEVHQNHTYSQRMNDVLAVLDNDRELHRTLDRDEILCIYSVACSQAKRLEHLVRFLFCAKCSLKTRIYIFLRLAKAVFDLARSKDVHV
jgi:hypothetical protein